MVDNRPANCRFRLQDEGKAYPRSSCKACGKTILTGLGRQCSNTVMVDITPKNVARYSPIGYDRGMEAQHQGGWVRFSDYEALAARLAEVEVERDAVMRAHFVSIESRLGEQVRAEAAEAENAKLREAIDVDIVWEALVDANDMDVSFMDFAKAVVAAIRKEAGIQEKDR